MDIKKDVKLLTRKLKIIEKFQYTSNQDKSLVKHHSNQEINTDNEWLQHIVNEIEGLDPEPVKIPNNVTKNEIKALEELKKNKNIIIKKADKTNIMVIMDM